MGFLHSHTFNKQLACQKAKAYKSLIYNGDLYSLSVNRQFLQCRNFLIGKSCRSTIWFILFVINALSNIIQYSGVIIGIQSPVNVMSVKSINI
jgi:hypothetical protein